MATPRTLRTRWTALLLGLAVAGLARAQTPPPSDPAMQNPARDPAASAAAPAAPTETVAAPTSGGVQPAGEGLRLTFSGFGTLGWAQSNREWAYQRYIDKDGTVERDSLLGGQMDAQLSSAWSATVQLKLAQSERTDHQWSLRTAWAFVAWRPDNDWLVRAGKLRVPFFLRSEHLDVGATYDEARLPAEIYGVVPTNDFQGVHVTRSWDVADGDLNLDAYWGSAKQTKRIWLREGMAGQVPAGAMFRDVTTDAAGLVTTWSGSTSKARLGVHRIIVKPTDGRGLPVRPSWAQLGPGIGYWQTSSELPGPGVEMTDTIENWFLTAGGEVTPAAGWRLTGEFGRIRQFGTERSLETKGGYLTLARELGAWTPYVTYSSLKSSARTRAWTHKLEETTVPSVVPGSDPLNASMRLSADSVPTYDQWSCALGGAYALSPTQKIKAEWLHTRARISSMYDLPAGEPLYRKRSVDVLSVNYNFTF